MGFRDNLQHLRATRNMTQEQLAMLVGVSRQSVTKWESERAYPEMDKLIKICDIFDCTLDELVSGDLTKRPDDPVLVVPPTAALVDVCGYDEQKRRFALRMAIGVGLIILGCAAAALLEGATPMLGNADAGSTIALFLFVAAGLLVLLPAAFANAAFAKAHPFVEDFYTSEQKEQARVSFGRELAVGVALVVAPVGIGALFDNNVTNALFFAGVAVGVGVIVHAALMIGRIDVEGYNLHALSELSSEEVAGLVGKERASQVIEKVRQNRRLGAICGIIMVVATILGLVSMFYGQSTGGFFYDYFWIFWMVGGLCCAIAAIAVKTRGGR